MLQDNAVKFWWIHIVNILALQEAKQISIKTIIINSLERKRDPVQLRFPTGFKKVWNCRQGEGTASCSQDAPKGVWFTLFSTYFKPGTSFLFNKSNAFYFVVSFVCFVCACWAITSPLRILSPKQPFYGRSLPGLGILVPPLAKGCLGMLINTVNRFSQFLTK